MTTLDSSCLQFFIYNCTVRTLFYLLAIGVALLHLLLTFTIKPIFFSLYFLNSVSLRYMFIYAYSRGVKLIFTGGHISLAVAFKGPNVILGLCKCNYSLTVKQELGAAAG